MKTTATGPELDPEEELEPELLEPELDPVPELLDPAPELLLDTTPDVDPELVPVPDDEPPPVESAYAASSGTPPELLPVSAEVAPASTLRASPGSAEHPMADTATKHATPERPAATTTKGDATR